MGEYISVTIIIHNVPRNMAPRNIVKIYFLPFIDKIYHEGKNHIAYDAIAPHMSMHAKNPVNR